MSDERPAVAADSTPKKEPDDSWTCPMGHTVHGNDARNHHCPICRKFYPMPEEKPSETPEKHDNLTAFGVKWTFDGDVARVFANMLERSIPDYREMRRLTYNLARRFVVPDGLIVDLGVSLGDGLAPLIETFGAQNRYLGVDVSKPMLEAAAERFQGMIKSGLCRIDYHDLRDGYPKARACLTLGVLTVQFVPIEYRMQLLRDLYMHTDPGGALFMVEKVLGATATLDTLLVAEYYDFKRRNGYTEEQIVRKKLALEGVLVPMSMNVNIEMLKEAGFRDVDVYWRSGNFAGFVAIKAAK